MAILEVEHVSKTFGKTEVLKDISFTLEKGDVVSIIGFLRKRQNHIPAVPELPGAPRHRRHPGKRRDPV